MNMLSLRRVIVPGIVAVATISCRAPVVPSSMPPQSAPSDSGAYIIMLGNDTVSAESYRRTGDRVEGVVVRRVPRTVVVRYTMTLNAMGLPSRFEYNTRLADGGRLPNGARTIVVTFTGDSAITQVVRDSTVTIRALARNAYPELDGSVALYALPIAALRRQNVDTAGFGAYSAGAAAASATPVARRGRNVYWLYSFGDPIEIATDDRGNILSVDGERTTFRIRGRRQSAVDVQALAVDFAERERAAGPIGALSPRDSVVAMIGGARLWVDYGRPAARGRTIFGPNGVLGDTLWRTGANASTKFGTDAALSMAGQPLSPGTYSIMTLAVPGRYQLIFYQDNVERLRVPLRAAPISPSVERFTITIEPAGDRAGTLRLRWDTMDLSFPFIVQ